MAITHRGERFSGYNKPKRTPGKNKKFAVLAKEGSTVRLVRFGDPNMTIKKNIPARRKSFRARHKWYASICKISRRRLHKCLHRLIEFFEVFTG